MRIWGIFDAGTANRKKQAKNAKKEQKRKKKKKKLAILKTPIYSRGRARLLLIRGNGDIAQSLKKNKKKIKKNG